LYDPFKARNAGHNQQKPIVSAPVGSLLKVWEGLLDMGKDSSVRCSLFSNIEVETFTQLPDLPSYLSLKGKPKLTDVENHFLRLRGDKRRLLKGWIARKQLQQGVSSQDNSDRYTKVFEELDSTQKSALFTVFHNITLYIVPITKNTRKFCAEMGINPDQCFRNEEVFEGEPASPDDFRNLTEETHLCAFFSLIKHSFDRYAS
jgi:hypothetical protein